MILTEAIEFSKQFPRCNPKIFTGFVEGKNCISKTQGYVFLTTLTNEAFSNQMEDYIKSHKLKENNLRIIG